MDAQTAEIRHLPRVTPASDEAAPDPPTKLPRGVWRPGQSGNRRGRPKKAFATRRASALVGKIEKAAPSIIEAMVKAALGGDVSAAKLLLDRVLPAARTVKINLPKIEGARDAMDALSQLLESAAAGEVTATEAEGLSKLARAYLETDTVARLEERLAALEQRLAEPQ